MTPHRAANSPKIHSVTRILPIALTAAIIAMTIACSAEQPPQIPTIATINRSPIQTTQALPLQASDQQTRVGGSSNTAGIDRQEPTQPAATTTPPVTPIPTATKPPTEQPQAAPLATAEPSTLPTPRPTATPMPWPTATPEPSRTPSPQSEKPASSTTTAQQTQADISTRDVSGMLLFTPSATGGAYDMEYEHPTVEEFLDNGMFAAEASPTHIVVRGTPEPDSTRCEWHGIARTLQQREETIRFWLGLDDSTTLPSPEELQTTFTAHVEQMRPSLREAMKVTFDTLVRGGETDEYFNLYCFVDYNTNSYLLGAGPARITVAYHTNSTAYAYDQYRTAHQSGSYEFEGEPLLGKSEYQNSYLNMPIKEWEKEIGNAVSRRESIIFLTPIGAHNNVSIMAWQAIAQWDLQQNETGTIQAVQYNLRTDHPESTQTLADLISRQGLQPRATTMQRPASPTSPV